MVEKTTCWKRIPSTSGVTFKGFEDVNLESREIVQSKIEEFLNLARNEDKTSARFLIAEWGEGKTDAFTRYIEPWCNENSEITAMITAKQIANSYEVLDKRDFFQNTTFDGIKLIASIFYVLKTKRKPSFSLDNQDPIGFIETSIQDFNDDESSKNKKIFFFIDEFEDLFLSKEDFLELFLSALKELINKNVEILNSKKFNILTSLHFIVCCTPNIFNRIKMHSRYGEIWGGIQRRVHEIDFPNISRAEGLKFLHELLIYSYKNSLPDVSPFKSEGILQTLFSVSLGNLGTMVQLFARLLGGKKIDNSDEIQITDYKLLFKFLEPEKISIYGGDSPIINKEMLKRLEDMVKRGSRRFPGQGIEFFNLLLGEMKPFSKDEIKDRLNFEGELTQLISSIEHEFRKNQYPTPIIPCVIFDDKKKVKEIFENYLIIKDEREFIDLGNNVLEFSKILDNFAITNIIDKKINYSYAVPCYSNGLESYFENTKKYILENIENAIERSIKGENSSVKFMINPVISQMVYPTPVPPDLDYINSREKRLELWREISLNYDFKFKSIGSSLIELLNKHPYFDEVFELTLCDLQKKDTEIIKFISLSYKKPGIDPRNYNILIYPKNEFERSDFDNTLNLQNSNIIHQNIIITSQILDESILNDLNKLSLVPTLIILRLPLDVGKRICVLNDVLLNSNISIDEKKIQSATKRLIDELDLISKIDDSFAKMKDNGWVIEDFKLTMKKDDMIKGFRFILNMGKDTVSIKNAFNHNRENLLKFFIYNKRTSLIGADIESEKELVKVTENLSDNNFGSLITEDTYKISENPVEGRIKSIVKQLNEIEIEKLNQMFVDIAKTQNLISDYLDILQFKGFVDVKGNKVKWISESDLFEDIWKTLELEYEDLKTNFNNKYHTLAVAKQREERIFCFNDFVSLMDNFLKQVNSKSSELEFQRQTIQIFDTFLQFFKSNWALVLSKAKREGESLDDRVEDSFANFNIKHDRIVNEVESTINMKLELLYESHEKSSLTSLYDRFKKTQELTEEETLELFEKIPNRTELFHFSKENITPYFNVKLHIVDESASIFFEKVEKFETILNSIDIQRIKQEKDELFQKTRELTLDKKYQISSNLKKKISKNLQNLSLPDFNLGDLNSIDGLSQLWGDISKKFKKSVSNLGNYFSNLENILSREKIYYKSKDNVTPLLQDARKYFDTEKNQLDLNRIEEDLKLSDESYIKARNTIDKVGLEDSDDISIYDTINEDMRKAGGLLVDLPNKLNEIVKNKITALQKDLDGIRGVWKKIKDKVDIKMPADYYTLKDEVTKTSYISGLNVSFKEIDLMLEKSKKSFYEQVTNVFSDDVLKVFLVVCKITENLKYNTFAVDTVFNLLKENNEDYTKKEVEIILESLYDDGYLKKNYSLI